MNTLILFGQTPANDPHWVVLWEDNFDFFDNSKWVKANYCDHGGEAQLFLEQNVDTLNGNLTFKLANTPHYCPANPTVTTWSCGTCVEGWHEYTSGWINTKPQFDIQYGFIEARIKLPYGNGFWPALWTFTAPNGDYEEIDIFEMVPGRVEYCDHLAFDNFTHNQYYMTTNIHSTTPSCEPHCNCNYSFQVNYINDYTSWHTYALEWSPNKIIFYVDGQVVRNSLNPQISNKANLILGIGLNPSVLPYTNIPAYLYVDYIKVYNLMKDCNTVVNTCSFNFNTYNNLVKKSISIGGSGCSNSVIAGTNFVLRAQDFIEIKGDFTVPIGAEFYMDANTCY